MNFPDKLLTAEEMVELDGFYKPPKTNILSGLLSPWPIKYGPPLVNYGGMSDKGFYNACVRDLKKTPGGLDGLVYKKGSYHSAHLIDQPAQYLYSENIHEEALCENHDRDKNVLDTIPEPIREPIGGVIKLEIIEVGPTVTKKETRRKGQKAPAVIPVSNLAGFDPNAFTLTEVA